MLVVAVVSAVAREAQVHATHNTTTSVANRYSRSFRASVCRLLQDAVAKLVRAGLRNPYRVNVAVTNGAGATTQKTPSSLTIEYLVVPSHQKVAQLLAFLRAHAADKCVVYALTCASVEWLAAVLPKLPGGDAMPLFALHGNMRQQHVRSAAACVSVLMTLPCCWLILNVARAICCLASVR